MVNTPVKNIKLCQKGSWAQPCGDIRARQAIIKCMSENNAIRWGEGVHTGQDANARTCGKRAACISFCCTLCCLCLCAGGVQNAIDAGAERILTCVQSRRGDCKSKCGTNRWRPLRPPRGAWHDILAAERIKRKRDAIRSLICIVRLQRASVLAKHSPLGPLACVVCGNDMISSALQSWKIECFNPMHLYNRCNAAIMFRTNFE